MLLILMMLMMMVMMMTPKPFGIIGFTMTYFFNPDCGI
jgi:hypothetical protein